MDAGLGRPPVDEVGDHAAFRHGHPQREGVRVTLRAVVLSTCLTFVAMLALTGGAAAAGPAPARVGLGVAARDVGDLPRGVVSAPTIAPALHLPRPPERGPSTNSPASKYSA